MEAGLVDVAARGRHPGGAVTGAEAVGGVVDTDQLRRALGCEADLGPEPGPQALGARPDLGCQPVDPEPAHTGKSLAAAGQGDVRVDHPACLGSSRQRGLRDREPVVTGGGPTPVGCSG